MPNTWDGIDVGIREGLGALAEGLGRHWDKQAQKEKLKKEMTGAESVYHKTTDLINQILQRNEQENTPPPVETPPPPKSEIDFTGEMPTKITAQPMTVGDTKGGMKMQSQKMDINQLIELYHQADATLQLKYGEAGKLYAKHLAENFDRALNNPDEKIYMINGKMIKVNQRTGQHQILYDGSKLPKKETPTFEQFKKMSYEDIVAQLTPKEVEDNLASFSDEALEKLFEADPDLKVVYDKKYKEKPVVKTGRVRVGTTKVEPLSKEQEQFNKTLEKIDEMNGNTGKMTPEERKTWEANKKDFATRNGLSVKQLEAVTKKYMNAKGKKEIAEVYDEVEESKTKKTASVEKVAGEIGMKKWMDDAYMIDTSKQEGVDALQGMIDDLWDKLGEKYNSVDEDTQPYMYNYVIETYVNPVLLSKGIPPIIIK